MNHPIALILGGGRGTRLFPLTKFRSKPAVPVLGKYRLIDIPISNCLNSGFNRIYVLTQFLSTSLHRHIMHTYKFDYFGQGFVEALAAQQTIDRSDWYQGTADAVRQNLRTVQERNVPTSTVPPTTRRSSWTRPTPASTRGRATCRRHACRARRSNAA